MEIENNVTISTHNGSQVARQHNLRNPKVITKEDHIDPNGHFEVWLDEDPKITYERLFGEAVKEYNKKQTREDRKITDYYKQICEDKKKKPVYELIIGIYGKKADGTPICSKNDGKRILRTFVEDWENRNPQLKLCGLYYHCDESVGVNGSQVGHVHIDYIAVGDGFARGMRTQSSLSRALEQQGFESQGLNNTAQMQWEARENQFLASLCAHAGYEVIRGNGNQEHLDTDTYKKIKELQNLQEKEATLVQSIAQKELWIPLTFGVGAVLSFIVMNSKDLFSQADLATIYHILSDSFLVSGVLLGGLGLLVFVSNEGVFDILIFGTKQFFGFFRKAKTQKFADFYEYKEARAQKKLKFGSILVCGAFYVLLSVIMLILNKQYL